MDKDYGLMAANAVAHEAFCAGQAWQQAASAQERPSVLWKPRLFRDGDQWCALLGENIQDGVVGFGSSPDAAMQAFDVAWREDLSDHLEAQPTQCFADAYQGAMEEVAIWKKRALEAEDLNRKFVAEINGPTYMGGPAHSKPDCGEAGHDEGRCGNKQCLPGAQLAPSVPEDAPQGAQNVASSQDAWKTLAKDLLREIERQTCTHEETHRGGFVWEICDSCGAKWADDEGGKPEFKWPKVVERAHAMLAAAPETKP